MSNLFLGSCSRKSIVGIPICKPLYWAILGIFVLYCVFCIVISVNMTKSE
jgi:hypothetical protein